jgi:predicted ATPase
LKSKRQQYHQQIAQVLEEKFPETKETQPELLAHHYTEAGLIAQALPYWQQAGKRATQHSAYVEAISHFIKGIELLKTLPDTPERAQQELTLQIALGQALIAAKGYAAPEVEQVYARARELCRRVGETPQLFPVLGGLFLFYFNRGEFQTVHELAKQLMGLAQSVQDSTLLMVAHLALGATLFRFGELVPTREHLEQSIALYDPQKDYPHASGVVTDPRVDSLSYAAHTLWLLGYPDQARTKVHEALTWAQELSHPHSLVFALTAAAIIHLLRREWQAAQEQAEALITLSNEQGFPYWLASGTFRRGKALAEQGQGEEGIAQMRQGLAAFLATGARVQLPNSLSLLAETYGKVGQAEEGLAVLAEALAMVNKTGECWWEAERYRLKGTLTLQKFQVPGSKFQVQESPRSEVRGPESEAEECFLKAIEIARKQQAKSLELRAVMSLARLWQQQGKTQEAHEMLFEIYSWFTEGFDTKDLQEAKALLDSLGYSV